MIYTSFFKYSLFYISVSGLLVFNKYANVT